jgi:hypothetical protein
LQLRQIVHICPASFLWRCRTPTLEFPFSFMPGYMLTSLPANQQWGRITTGHHYNKSCAVCVVSAHLGVFYMRYKKALISFYLIMEGRLIQMHHNRNVHCFLFVTQLTFKSIYLTEISDRWTQDV